MLFWANTLADLELTVRLRFGEEMAKAAQAYETLADVVSRALGGGTSDDAPLPGEMRPKNVHEMMAAFNAVLKPPKEV